MHVLNQMIGILLAIANAKSGITWALNVATVEIIWFVTSGPGSIDGNKISILPCTLFIKAQSLMENFYLILGGNVRLCYVSIFFFFCLFLMIIFFREGKRYFISWKKSVCIAKPSPKSQPANQQHLEMQ
jgi:hypothetical protein